MNDWIVGALAIGIYVVTMMFFAIGWWRERQQDRVSAAKRRRLRRWIVYDRWAMSPWSCLSRAPSGPHQLRNSAH